MTPGRLDFLRALHARGAEKVLAPIRDPFGRCPWPHRADLAPLGVIPLGYAPNRIGRVTRLW
ncbi:hypothetical protein TJA_00720 [Thermus sp. LT1-2-5]